MDRETIKTSLGYFCSGALIMMNIQAILDPVSASQTYGIPNENITSSYVPVMAARNIAQGLSIGALLYQGQKRAVGTVLSTAFVVGALDTWLTYRYAGQISSAVVKHVVGDGFAGALGLWYFLAG